MTRMARTQAAGSTRRPASAQGSPQLSHQRAKPRRNWAEVRAAYAFLSPWLIGFAVFTAAPMAISLYLSFTDYNGINSPRSVGTSHYPPLFSDPKETPA